MNESLCLTNSLEDYLEAILELEEKNRVARVKEIAEKLSVQMPSVTSALKTLKGHDLVDYEKNSYIRLTEAGLKYARSILNRHAICRSFLEHVLLLDADLADGEACLIEHIISPETANRLKKLTRYMNNRENLESWRGYLQKTGH